MHHFLFSPAFWLADSPRTQFKGVQEMATAADPWEGLRTEAGAIWAAEMGTFCAHVCIFHVLLISPVVNWDPRSADHFASCVVGGRCNVCTQLQRYCMSRTSCQVLETSSWGIVSFVHTDGPECIDCVSPTSQS